MNVDPEVFGDSPPFPVRVIGALWPEGTGRFGDFLPQVTSVPTVIRPLVFIELRAA